MNEIVALIGGLGLLLPILAGLALLLYLVPIPLWIAAWASGAYVGLLTLIGMRLRRVPPTTVVTARISAVTASTSSGRVGWASSPSGTSIIAASAMTRRTEDADSVIHRPRCCPHQRRWDPRGGTCPAPRRSRGGLRAACAR